ncbi:carbohydrate esterase family protein [Paramyrothecium foliicola]|nr:carbohydrate esterase family protein [Paramyrothecium foliicola]
MGTMLSKYFAIFLLALGVEAVPRTSPPSGAKVVAKSGGQYTSLQSAINSIDKASTGTTTIFIQPGSYTGQTTITSGYKGKIVIYGYTTEDQDYTKNQAILTNSLSSSQAGGNEQSGTLRIQTPNVSLYNLRVENTAGDAGPSHALSIGATNIGFYGCAFTGWQDTMYGRNTDSVFKNSYIEGAVDFIYGGGNVNFWFEKTDIGFNRASGGYITASGRETDTDPGWYVFNGGRVFAKSGVSVKAGSVFLGRPWRAAARTVFQRTDLSNIVHPEGWNPWDKGNDLSRIYYAEYANTGAGASTSKRVSWSKQLSSAVSIDSTIPAWKSWVDQNYWNNVSNGGSPTQTTTTKPPSSTNPPSGCESKLWEQCGGSGWSGCTKCASGSTCKAQNEWYSQCLA